jgi:hypothetical protein
VFRKQDRNTGVGNEIAGYVFMYEELTEKLNRGGKLLGNRKSLERVYKL